MSAEAWRRQFPNAELHDVIDAFAELVADKVAERIPAGERRTVDRAGFSPKEAGEYLGCSERHVRTLCDDGLIAFARLGSRIVIHRSTLDALMLAEATA